MTSPPPYEGNPDGRPLPAGWISQYDSNYKAWFYVNTHANPPMTTWVHPSGPVSAPPVQTFSPPPAFSPPSMPPPMNAGGYNPGQIQGPGGYGNNNQVGYPNGGGMSYPQQQQQQPPYGGGYGNPGYNYPQQGPVGGGYPVQQPQQPQVVVVEQKPQVVVVEEPRPHHRHHGMGAGGLAMGAGAGLLGGILIGEAIEERREERRERDFGWGPDWGYDGWRDDRGWW